MYPPLGNTKGQDYTWLNGEITHFDFDAFFQNATAVDVGPARDDWRPNSPDQKKSSSKQKKGKGARSKETNKVVARVVSEDEGGSQGNRNGVDGLGSQPGESSKEKVSGPSSNDEGSEAGEHGSDDTDRDEPTSKVAQALKLAKEKRKRRNGDDDDDEASASVGSDNEEDPRLKRQRLDYTILFNPAAVATGDTSDGM
jgi:hypothetical protein